MKIRQKEIEEKKVKETIKDWNAWSCDPSTFDWEYNDLETAYVYEGEVIVRTSEETVEIKGGQLVQFPKGMKCKWEVIKPIRKVYTFQNLNWKKLIKELDQ
jgi:uncharacterized cupin superfamily protein